jgi:predicted ArsR family transcriptional regulator
MSGITRDEWLSALNEPVNNDPNAITVVELAAMLQIGRTAAKERMAKLVKDGKAVRLSKIVTNQDGRRHRVPAYKLLPAKKK